MSIFDSSATIFPRCSFPSSRQRPPRLGYRTPRSIGAVKVLRISITDRCNFRCVYCMPAAGVEWLPKQEILSFEEIADVVRAAIEVHGIRRFKLTGGEPTVRNRLCDLVRLIRRIDGIEDLSLTTNGMRLEDLAQPLKESGLDRVTVSVDSLRADRFARITRTGDLRMVLRGLDRAEDVGLLPLKINCVTMRGTNDDEFADFARMTLTRRLTVRFIEYMPLGDAALGHSLGPWDRGLRGYAHTSAWEGTPEDPDLMRRSALRPRISTEETGPSGGCGAQDRGRWARSSPNPKSAPLSSESLVPWFPSIELWSKVSVPQFPISSPAAILWAGSASSARCHNPSVRPAIACVSPPAESCEAVFSKAAKWTFAQSCDLMLRPRNIARSPWRKP